MALTIFTDRVRASTCDGYDNSLYGFINALKFVYKPESRTVGYYRASSVNYDLRSSWSSTCLRRSAVHSLHVPRCWSASGDHRGRSAAVVYSRRRNLELTSGGWRGEGPQSTCHSRATSTRSVLVSQASPSYEKINFFEGGTGLRD